MVEERDVEIGADQHAQADLAQVAPVLLVVAAGGQLGRGAGVDEGEEIGAVIDQGAQGQAQLLDEPLGERLLDGADVRLADLVHVVPEGLAGELVGGGGQQARQDGVVVPMGQLGLAGGVGGAVDGGQQQVLADREALVALGDLGIDEFDQADLAGLVKEGGDIAEAGQAGSLGPEGLLGLGDGLDDMVQGAEIDGFDDFRFAVHALALAGVVIGASLEDFGGQRGHDG